MVNCSVRLDEAQNAEHFELQILTHLSTAIQKGFVLQSCFVQFSRFFTLPRFWRDNNLILSPQKTFVNYFFDIFLAKVNCFALFLGLNLSIHQLDPVCPVLKCEYFSPDTASLGNQQDQWR